MSISIKSIFIDFLLQLEKLAEKIPSTEFENALSKDMFCLAIQAKIAANFALRGYCPLVGKDVVSFDQPDQDKASVIRQIRLTKDYIQRQEEAALLANSDVFTEKAGFATVRLPQSEFIHRYILPNFYFHISMVYAIARSSGVKVSKADFDGLHQYPSNFSFIDEET